MNRKNVNTVVFENKEIKDEVLRILEENRGWEDIYAGYAKDIADNQEMYKLRKEKFMVHLPLVRYSSISLVKGNRDFALRYAGENVATIRVSKDMKPKLKLEEDHVKRINKYKEKLEDSRVGDFCGGISNWNGKNSIIAHTFRQLFYSDKEFDTHSKEHRIESRLLLEFSKKKDKSLLYIQPVRLGGLFFQLTTPIKASDHNQLPTFSMKRHNGNYYSASGGGIDILARVKKHKGDRASEWRLAVIELKDENTRDEPQRVVIQQALAYATFILRLLRSEECGKEWFNLFRDQNKHQEELPDKLKIDVISLLSG